MSKNPAPDSAGGLESPEPPERALARAIVADAVDRYLEATRARIAPFVDDHFSFTGAWALHRRALGRDLLRAPVNVMLVLPQVVLLPAGAALARWVGWRRAADWLGSRQLLRETDVVREIAWLVRTELLRLPYRQGRRESTRDALAEEVLRDPRTGAADRGLLEELARRTGDAAFRRDLEDKLDAYKLSRSAVAELCTAIVSVAIGAAVFRQLTFGVRIPVQPDHRFRRKPITDSDSTRSLIPAEADHRFRCQADHFSAMTGIVHGVRPEGARGAG